MNFTFVKENKFLSTLINFVFSLIFSFIRFIVPKNKNGRTVIIALHKLGDCVFTLEAIQRIFIQQNGGITIVCFPETTDIFRMVLERAEYLELNHSDFFMGERFSSRNARRKLKNAKPTTVFDLTGSVTSATLIFNSSASIIVGTNESFYKNIYTHYAPLRTEPHVKDIYLDAIKSFVNINNVLIKNESNRKSGRYIGIHPFAGWEAKEWNLKKFISLAENLVEKFPVKFVSAPNEIENDVKNYLKQKGIDIVETKTTKDLIDFIREAFLLIGNDSGPVHIANLLSIPTFTIYGPTNPEFHKPSEGVNEYIFKQLKCSPKPHEKVCFTNGGRNGCPSFECMNLLSVESVLANIKNLLEKKCSIK